LQHSYLTPSSSLSIIQSLALREQRRRSASARTRATTLGRLRNCVEPQQSGQVNHRVASRFGAGRGGPAAIVAAPLPPRRPSSSPWRCSSRAPSSRIHPSSIGSSFGLASIHEETGNRRSVQDRQVATG